MTRPALHKWPGSADGQRRQRQGAGRRRGEDWSTHGLADGPQARPACFQPGLRPWPLGPTSETAQAPPRRSAEPPQAVRPKGHPALLAVPPSPRQGRGGDTARSQLRAFRIVGRRTLPDAAEPVSLDPLKSQARARPARACRKWSAARRSSIPDHQEQVADPVGSWSTSTARVRAVPPIRGSRDIDLSSQASSREEKIDPPTKHSRSRLARPCERSEPSVPYGDWPMPGAAPVRPGTGETCERGPRLSGRQTSYQRRRTTMCATSRRSRRTGEARPSPLAPLRRVFPRPGAKAKLRGRLSAAAGSVSRGAAEAMEAAEAAPLTTCPPKERRDKGGKIFFPLVRDRSNGGFPPQMGRNA